MSRFKIQNKEDNIIIEIVAMNIDNENNVLIKENNSVSTISLDDFKDMVLGTTAGEKATYIILD